MIEVDTVSTPRPAMTPPLALLLVAIGRYLERARLQEVRDGISELEIQKLAYFLQTLGAPLRLTFVRGRYGPYSDQLAHVLDSLGGHYLSGYGGRSARVPELVPINLTDGALDEAQAELDRHPQDNDRVSALCAMADGFETPYSLELLATVHFAASQEPATADPDVLSDRVAGWGLRKARLFTEEHVHLAARRLAEHGLLAT